MIDWTAFDSSSPSAWAKLGELLIANAQVAVGSLDEQAMKAAMDDILAYVAKPSLAKQAACVTALRRVQTQLAQARQALAIGELGPGSDRLEAIVARMSSASSELKLERAVLQLTPLRDALAVAGDVMLQVNALQAQLESLPRGAIAERLATLLTELETLRAHVRSASAG